MSSRKVRVFLKRSKERCYRSRSLAKALVHRLRLRVERRRKTRTTRCHIYDRPHQPQGSMWRHASLKSKFEYSKDVSQFWESWHPFPVVSTCHKIPQVDPETVYALQPSLKGMRLQDLRAALWKSSCEYKCWHAVVQIVASNPRSHLPRQLELVMDEYGLSTTPSHYIALHSTSAAGPHRSTQEKNKTSIIPVHAFILALFCSRISTYPPSKRVVTAAGRRRISASNSSPPMDVQYHSLRLPVLPIAIPDPSTFMTLLQYFYTGDIPSYCVNAAPYLLVIPAGFPRGRGDDRSESYARTLSVSLAKTYSPPWLRQFSERLWWLSWNLVTLGVSDQRLWDVLHTQTSCLAQAILLQRSGEVLPSIAPRTRTNEGTR